MAIKPQKVDKPTKPKTDVNTMLAEGLIKQYLKDNLSISLNVETNDFMSTDCSTRTRFTVSIAIDGEEVCSDSYSS